MKKIKLFEEFLNENSTWEKLSAKSKEMFGEWVIDVLTEEDMAKIINLKEADKLARKKYGEFGFATLDLDSMRELINKYPNLVKKGILNESKNISREELMDYMSTKYGIKSVKTTEEFSGETDGIWMAGDNDEILGNDKIFDYYNKSSKYVFGVLKKVNTDIKGKGWYFSWNDPGTIMLWPNS